MSRVRFRPCNKGVKNKVSFNQRLKYMHKWQCDIGSKRDRSLEQIIGLQYVINITGSISSVEITDYMENKNSLLCFLPGTKI